MKGVEALQRVDLDACMKVAERIVEQTVTAMKSVWI